MLRHPKAIEPGPGQESVWDYPRPPRIEPVCEPLKVVFAGQIIAQTTAGFRVLETSHPPVYYLPPSAVSAGVLHKFPGSSYCEFKGAAAYWSINLDGQTVEHAAWSYPNPTTSFAALADYLAFYASKVDQCWVGDDLVDAQEGDFYGGWITDKVVGPFKGAPGTRFW